MEAKIQKQMERLIEQAERAHPDCTILPCGPKKDLKECFTSFGSNLFFWFNTSKDNSTRMLRSNLEAA